MFRLEAPLPAIASTILLPSPEMGNNMGLRAQVNAVKMMDGSTRTFVKAAGSKRLHRFVFTLSSNKVEELEDYVTHFRGSQVRAVWRDKKVEGFISLNPVELIGAGRAGGWPGEEAYSVTLEIVER